MVIGLPSCFFHIDDINHYSVSSCFTFRFDSMRWPENSLWITTIFEESSLSSLNLCSINQQTANGQLSAADRMLAGLFPFLQNPILTHHNPTSCLHGLIISFSTLLVLYEFRLFQMNDKKNNLSNFEWPTSTNLWSSQFCLLSYQTGVSQKPVKTSKAFCLRYCLQKT